MHEKNRGATILIIILGLACWKSAENNWIENILKAA